MDRIRSIIGRAKAGANKHAEKSEDQPGSKIPKQKVDIRPSRYVKGNNNKKRNTKEQKEPSKIPRRVPSEPKIEVEEPSPETRVVEELVEEETEMERMIKNQRKVLGEIETKTEIFKQIQDDEKMKRAREKIYKLTHQAELLRDKRRQEFHQMHTCAEETFKTIPNRTRFIADTDDDYLQREIAISTLQNIIFGE